MAIQYRASALRWIKWDIIGGLVASSIPYPGMSIPDAGFPSPNYCDSANIYWTGIDDFGILLPSESPSPSHYDSALNYMAGFRNLGILLPSAPPSPSRSSHVPIDAATMWSSSVLFEGLSILPAVTVSIPVPQSS